jgi:hypothetical protein
MNIKHIQKKVPVLMGAACLTLQALTSCTGNASKSSDTAAYSPVAPVFEADSAMKFVEAQCSFGPRTMNSAAHDSCAAWLEQTFRRLGAEVVMQRTTVTLYDGTKAPAVNIIARYRPESSERILLCAHWDSRPWADNDPNEAHHRTPIDGANDGASGVAVLLELARLMQSTPPEMGVDLICFDAEDCGTPQWADDGSDHEHTWCLGSQYWAQNRIADGYSARYGILLDMVGGQHSVFRKELFSMRYAPEVVDRVWSLASLLGHQDYFLFEQGMGVTDDHLPINESGIPCIDVIGNDKEQDGFERTWHTMADNVSNISRETLRAVGRTMAEVIYTER